jgi:hypothetical protein
LLGVMAVAMCVTGGGCSPKEASGQPGGRLDMNQGTRCAADGSLIALPDIPEASGLAASIRTPGIFWTMNDSRDPLVYAIDSTGATRGQVRIAGAKTRNWEALGVATCRAGSCLYIGDIGDNSADRKSITVYRVPEPAPGDSVSEEAQAFHATYPNGAQDAEAMVVTERREVFIITKGETGNIAVYRFPSRTARNGVTVELERVSKIEGRGARRRDMITDAALSPDGSLAAMRSKRELFLYDAKELLTGKTVEPFWTEDLTDLGEPQGEGVAFGPGHSIYLAGEGGAKGRPGTFLRMQCEAGTK